jgi:hypothetical protein
MLRNPANGSPRAVVQTAASRDASLPKQISGELRSLDTERIVGRAV